MENIRIIGILISNRIKEATEIQTILTEFGCSIKTRLGLHEIADSSCSKNGLILLELKGDKKDWDSLEAKLSKIDGITVKRMDF